MADVIFSEDTSQNVTDTSKESHAKLLKTGELGRQEAKVLQAFRNMDYIPTRNEVKQEQLPGMEKSTLAARVRALIDQGRLEKTGKRKDRYNNRKAETLKEVNA